VIAPRRRRTNVVRRKRISTGGRDFRKTNGMARRQKTFRASQYRPLASACMTAHLIHVKADRRRCFYLVQCLGKDTRRWVVPDRQVENSSGPDCLSLAMADASCFDSIPRASTFKTLAEFNRTATHDLY
jgi:hypothetical protein